MSDELREEAEATLAARVEVGQELEPQLVDRFADRVEQEIDRRARELATQRRPTHNAPMIPLALGSLGLAIPLIAIAKDSGAAAVIAVCLAIVLVNLLWATRR